MVELLGLSNPTVTSQGDTATFGSTDLSWETSVSFDFEVRIGADCETGTAAAGASNSGVADPSVTVVSTIVATDPALSEGPNTLHVCAVDGPNDLSVLETSVTLDDTPPADPTGLIVTPASPANDNSPTVSGGAEADAVVAVHADDPGCGGGSEIGSSAAGAAGNFAVDALVGDDSTINEIFLALTDAVGNANCFGTGLSYTEDSSPPSSPGFSGSLPASPANDNGPSIEGSAEADSLVALFSDAACTAQEGSSQATAGGLFSVSVSVGDDTATTFYATAEDAAGNVSTCSAGGITYTEDSLSPDPPVITGVVPSPPANDNGPAVQGMAEANASIRLYSDALCASQVGSGVADGSGDFSTNATVADDSVTVLYATATDAAGNVSGCSTTSVSYTEDSTPPDPPVLTGTTPVSPANNNNPSADGTAEPNAAVYLYFSSNCTGGAVETGAADGGGNFSILLGALVDNVTIPLSVQAQDAAGNISNCSNSITYVEDSSPPSPPSFTSTSPSSPGGDDTPQIIGTAEAGSTVRLYTNSTCTSSLTAEGSAADFASTGLTAAAVGSGSTTTFYGTTTDAAGNTSGCSSGSITYTHNPPPVFTNLPASVSCTLGDAVNFTATATDAEALTFSEGSSNCGTLSGGLMGQSVAANGDVTLTCAPIDTDTCNVAVQVSDGITTVTANLAINPENVWFVNGAVASSGNGRRWATAFKNPSEAQSVAASGDSVWVAAGTYRPTGFSFSGPLPVISIDTSLQYYGGFLPGASSLVNRDPLTNQTILDADMLGGPSTIGAHVIRVGVPQAVNSRFDGFVIRNGGTGNSLDFGGGGIITDGAAGGGASLTVANCWFDNNAALAGGGIYTSGPVFNLTVQDCLFTNNQAVGISASTGQGGAVYAGSAIARIISSTFLGNFASCVPGSACTQAMGGALRLSNAPAVVNSVFEGNFLQGGGGATGLGGAISIPSPFGIGTIINSSFRGNDVPFSLGSEGGAVYVGTTFTPGSRVLVQNSAFWGNTAPAGAGEHVQFSNPGDALSFSCIQGGFTGVGNAALTVDPFNIMSGQYFLNATAGGGAACENAGDNSAADASGAGYPLTGYNWRDLTTRSDSQSETDVDGAGTEAVDAGVHYVP